LSLAFASPPDPAAMHEGSVSKPNCQGWSGAGGDIDGRGFVNSALLVELHPIVAGTTASSSWTGPCGVVNLQLGG